MLWSEVGVRVYLGGGEYGIADPLTGTVRGTDQTDYYDYSGDGTLERVPWKDVYSAFIAHKEKLRRRHQRRYGDNAKLETSPPHMTNNVYINKIICNKSPTAESPPVRRASTSSTSSTKTVYVTEEDVTLFKRFFQQRGDTGIDFQRLVDDQVYMSSVLITWNPLVYVKRSNLERMHQKIQRKRREKERQRSTSSEFDPKTYDTFNNRKKQSFKRKRDENSDSDDKILPRKSPRVNKIDSESEESIEKDNLSLKEFAASLGLKEKARLTRNSLSIHDRMNEIENQKLIDYKRRMIERNQRKIREKMKFIRENERVIKEKEMLLRDNESDDDNENQKSTRSNNEMFTKNNERSSKNKDNTKENEKLSKHKENLTKEKEKSSKNDENKKSTKENEQSSKNREPPTIRKSIRNEKSTTDGKSKDSESKDSKSKHSESKDGKSKDSESKVLKEKNLSTTSSEVVQRKLKCRPPIQREYSTFEDHTIVSLVSVGGRARLVSGNALWKGLVDSFKNVTNVTRTWQSLRNRYLRYILPNLRSLHLDEALQSSLRADAARGAIKRKGNRASILHREEELPAASTRNKPPPFVNKLTIDYDQPSTSNGSPPRKSPRISEPARHSPKKAEPSRTNSKSAEPSRTSPRAAEPSRTNSKSVETSRTSPRAAEPIRSSLRNAESSRTSPRGAQTSRTSVRFDEQSLRNAETGRTSLRNAETSRTILMRAERSELIPPRTRQSSIKKYLRSSTSKGFKPETPRRRQLYNPRI